MKFASATERAKWSCISARAGFATALFAETGGAEGFRDFMNNPGYAAAIC